MGDFFERLLGHNMPALPERDELVEPVVLQFGDWAGDKVWAVAGSLLHCDLLDISEFADVSVLVWQLLGDECL